ncbi:hypothetical protein AK830_g10192 [Neonectria ditissima]|uniref:PH domain-containing protein n=1 Tax=Neonectria ditissima TaxID=78410 RepID=A0A0P7AQH4_9HYPO|nr:hypothetical protein AK830_g10192 [Neonectria ditissima]
MASMADGPEVAPLSLPRREHQKTLTPPPAPKLAAVSRYRSLRGKSVSSITRRRAFDVYNDTTHLAHGNCYPHLDSPSLTRRRSKSEALSPTPQGIADSPTSSLSASSSSAVVRPPVPQLQGGLAQRSVSAPTLEVAGSYSGDDQVPVTPPSTVQQQQQQQQPPSWTPPPPPPPPPLLSSRGLLSNPSSADANADTDAAPSFFASADSTLAASLSLQSFAGDVRASFASIGGLAPRAAVGAVGNAPEAPLPQRPASPSPASAGRVRAPSPVVPTTTTNTSIPGLDSSGLNLSSSRNSSPSREGLFKTKSKSRPRTKSKSKSKSKPRLTFRPPAPPPIPPAVSVSASASSSLPVSTPAAPVVAPPPPPPPPPPPAEEVARRKAFNLLAFRLNSSSSSRAAEPDRTPVDRRTKEEQEADRWAAEVARLEAETDRIIAEQKKRDAARVRAHLASPPPRLTKYLLLDKLPFLSRGRRSNATTSQTGTPSPKASTVFSLEYSRASSLEDSLSSDNMSFIQQGGKGTFDAPTSASNGGERVSLGVASSSSASNTHVQRVTVRCLSSTINLPITPDTSPVDVLYSTANLTSHDINPKTSVIVECYVDLGLERRLRRYERIRDVMNSWDRDQQNSLLVLTTDISENNADLDIDSVARTPNPPPGFTLQLYHSSRPGKWNKRWVTLLESGQMFASKKPDAKASDKDSTVLCHLSDFDIYTPRESEVKRHLKAPRRFCYAVKSQQKTVVFPNGENFVHFFCAEDAQLAQRFREHVQGWRSWYLVTKQVDFEKKSEPKPKPYERVVPDKPPRISHRSCPTNNNNKGNVPKSISTVTNGSHRLKVSVDESPYTIGDFQPLIDLNRFDKPIEDFGKDFEAVPPPQPKPVHRSKTVSQKPKLLTQQIPSTPFTAQDEGAFSAGGLLGKGYEEKRQMAEFAERNERISGSSHIPSDSAFTDGPSLLNTIHSPVSPPREKKPEVRPWLPSASEHSAARSRSKSGHSSQRAHLPASLDNIAKPPVPVTAPAIVKSKSHPQPQPLVNLTNSFPEPPHWRESKGHGHKAPTTNGPLINFATGGPADANPIGPGLIRSSTRGSNANKPLLSGSATLSSSSGSQISRARSRSIVAAQSQPSLRPPAPPVPPLPSRSIRREKTQSMEPPRGRDPRPREPLINRAGTSNVPSMPRY